MEQIKILVAASAVQLSTLQAGFAGFEEIDLLTAHNSRQVLARAREKRPHLVILDAALQPESGDHCCRQLRQDPWLRNLPVIILAGGRPGQERELCRQWRCQQVLLKPVHPETLATVLRDFVSLFPLTEREQRVEKHWPVRFGRSEQTREGGTSIDLSTGGMFLQTATLYTNATIIFLEFSLPGCSEPLRCRARVAWVNRADEVRKAIFPQGMGLQFLDLPAIGREAIRLFLEESREASYH